MIQPKEYKETAASQAKRVAVENEEIPTRAQLSAKPETEQCWDFLSWRKRRASNYLHGRKCCKGLSTESCDYNAYSCLHEITVNSCKGLWG